MGFTVIVKAEWTCLRYHLTVEFEFNLKFNFCYTSLINYFGGLLFCIDERIQTTCFSLGDWPLSRILLKNEARYPWFILIPRKDNIQELFQLEKKERQILIEEINHLSLLVHGYFKPDKLNIGALGNVVPQLHVHVVARSKHDDLWPQGLWQKSMQATPYDEKKINGLLPILQDLIQFKVPEIS